MTNTTPLAVGQHVTHVNGPAGTILALYPEQGIAQVHFPAGITATTKATNPGQPATATTWHVRISTLTPTT